MSDTMTVTYWAVMQDGNLAEPFTSEYATTFHATRNDALIERNEWRGDVVDGSDIHIVRIEATITLDKDA